MTGHAGLHDLRATQVRAVLTPERALTLPPPPAVTVRGALGRAVMDLECVREDADSTACALLAVETPLQLKHRGTTAGLGRVSVQWNWCCGVHERRA